MYDKTYSTRKAAGEALLELAKEGFDVAAVAADTSKSMFTTLLGKEFPDRFFEMGIAEQNMIMVAAGLASTGKIAFAASYSVFTSMRCLEQIRTFTAYPDLNVKILAGLGGLSGGIEGVTHVATEDLGIVRCIPNVTVIAPSDAVSTRMAVKAAAERQGPVYIRLGRDPSPVIFPEAFEYKIGYPIVHHKGQDLTIVATGIVLVEALRAAEALKKEGIDVGVIEVHTLKPVLDETAIVEASEKTGNIITVEEHNIVGGLGTVISEILSGKMKYRIKRLGLKDVFAESGTPAELRNKYKLNEKWIAEEARSFLNKS